MKPVELSEGERGFVEAVGAHTASFGLPRIAGRTFALLMIAPRPLALEEVARLLKVSRASVSINTRIGMATGVVERVSVAGDRRTFYAFSDHAYEHRIALLERHLTGITRIVRESLATLPESNIAARHRLEFARDFLGLLTGKFQEIKPLLTDRARMERPS
jgi:DNA-binding transcriptional regulator GbsR (MarR family)